LEGAIGGLGNRVNRGPSGHECPRSRGVLEAPRSAEHVVGAALKRTDRAEARSDRAQRDSDHEPKGSGYGLVGDIAVGIIGGLLFILIVPVDQRSGLVGTTLVALIGAAIFVGVARVLTRRTVRA